ncbi:amidohydrolase [Enterococcus sp. LJL98]
MKQLIKNVHLLTMDEKMTEIPHAFVLIEKEKIARFGEMTEELPKAEIVIDGQGGILMPGMINTHTHAGMVPFRSLGDDVPDRLRRFLFPLEQFMTPALVKASSKYAMAEMLLAGVTTFCDMYYFEEEVAEAAVEMQMRGLVGETIIDMATCDFPTPKAALEWTEGFIQRWLEHPLITPMIAPHATNTNTKEDFKAIVALASKYQVPISMHVAEMTYEMTEFQEKYQQTPIAFLNEFGFFDERLIMAHCLFIEEGDWSLLRQHQEKLGIAHCIGANTKSAKGVAPVKRMLAEGLHVGLGTDGPSSGNTLDLFTQMRMFANFQKTDNADRGLFPAKEIVHLATKGGSDVLGLGHLVGTIEKGKQADLTLVETQSVNMFPIYDAYSALVYSANSSNVSAVWVNGQQLVREKKLVHVDVNELREALRKEMTVFVAEAKKRSKDLN